MLSHFLAVDSYEVGVFLLNSQQDIECKRAFVHLKELLASIKVKLDPRFVSLPGSETAVKFRGQRDCCIRVRERFTHKALVERNLRKQSINQSTNQQRVTSTAPSPWVWSNSTYSPGLFGYWLLEANAYEAMLLLMLLILQSDRRKQSVRFEGKFTTSGLW